MTHPHLPAAFIAPSTHAQCNLSLLEKLQQFHRDRAVAEREADPWARTEAAPLRSQ